MPNNSSAGSEILSRLQQAPTIHPASARLFTDWSLEPGDVVTVKSDEEAYMVPIYTMLMEWTGAPMVDVSSSGNQKREPLPALTRRDYATRSAINGMRQKMEDQEEINQQYQHFRTETNQQLTSVYKITGVKLDANGKPIYQQATDAQGNPLWETDGQGNYVLDEDGNRIPILVYDEAGNPVPVYDPDSTGSISGTITQTAQSLNILYEQTGGVTEQFDPEKQYHAGDYVLSPNGVSCRFKVDHLGPWNNEDVVFVPNLQAQITTNATEISNRVTQTSLTQTLGSYITQNAYSASIGAFLDDNGKLSVAKITTEINKTTGEGIATINADHVYITGSTLLSGKVTIDSNGVFVIKNSTTKFEGDDYSATINNGHISGRSYTVSGGNLTFTLTSGAATESYIITPTKAANLVTDLNIAAPDAQHTHYRLQKKTVYLSDAWTDVGNLPGLSASVSGNTLTLTDASGNTINFRKATTLAIIGTYTVNGASVTAGWSGGTYTVVATQTNYNTTTEQDETTVVNTASTAIRSVVVASAAQGTVVKTDMNVKMKVLYDNGDPESNGSETGFTSESIAIDATDVYNYGRNSVNVTGPTWNTYQGDEIPSSRQATFTTDAPQPNANAAKTLSLLMNMDTQWSASYTKKVYVRPGSTSADPVMEVSVDASALVGSGDVDVVKGSWSSGAITFSPASGNGSSKSVALSIDAPIAITQNTTVTVYDGNDTTGVSLKLHPDADDTYVYIKDASENVVARRVHYAFTHGQQSVNVSSATLSNIVANSSARTATASLTIYLDNNKSKTVDNVDVSSIYQAGLDGSTAISNKNFSVKLADNNGNGTVVKTDVVSVDVSAVYQQGVDDAAPAVTHFYIWADEHSVGGAVAFEKASNAADSDIVGELYRNSYVTVISGPHSGNNRQWYLISYGQHQGYVSASVCHNSPRSGYSTRTDGVWYKWYGSGSEVDPEYQYTGTIKESTALRASASGTSTSIMTLSANTSVLCDTNISTITDGNTWIGVKTKGSNPQEGYVQAKYFKEFNSGSTPEYQLTSFSVTGVFHETTGSATTKYIKMKLYGKSNFVEYASSATYTAQYQAMTTVNRTSQYLATTYSGSYHAWHNASTWGTGDMYFKVRIQLNYSNGTDSYSEEILVPVTSRGSNTYNNI